MADLNRFPVESLCCFRLREEITTCEAASPTVVYVPLNKQPRVDILRFRIVPPSFSDNLAPSRDQRNVRFSQEDAPPCFLHHAVGEQTTNERHVCPIQPVGKTTIQQSPAAGYPLPPPRIHCAATKKEETKRGHPSPVCRR